MLGEFKFDQAVFVHYSGKKYFFVVNNSVELLIPQLATFYVICFKAVFAKIIQENKLYFLFLKFVIFPQIQTFQIFNLLEIIP